SKPRSHWIYRVASQIKTKTFKSKSEGMIVELRSTGMHTVFPPSTHVSGESIRWEDENADPATVDPDELIECLQRLADAVKDRLGETLMPGKKRRTESGGHFPDRT